MNKPVIFCEEALALNQLELLTPDTMVLPFKRFAVSDEMQLVCICANHVARPCAVSQGPHLY